MLKRNFFVGILIFLLMLLSLGIITNTALSDNPFPHNWEGTWSGIMYDRTVQGKSQIVPMTLQIKPVSQNPRRYTWQITYGAGVNKIVRNYELVAQNQDAGNFAIDEKDGTLIDVWWLSNQLYSQFRVGNRFISTQYQLQNSRLHYELVVYQSLTPQTQVSQQKTSFESYQLQSVQSAELSPVKE